MLSAKTNATLAAQKKTKDGAAPNLYSRFMQVLYSLLDGSMDNSKFEDDCRAIIGTQSYVLFTLDKLIFKLVKQLQAAVADDVAVKLLSLHAYEKAGEAVDMVYHLNASVLLHDENIYRFEHRSSENELLIQLMEPGGSEKLEVFGNTLESSFQNYLDDLFLSRPTQKNHRVFMQRNKKRKLASEDEDFILQCAMENVRVVNGLEYKISCHTSKVSYVLDTEDMFVRCAPLRLKNPDGQRLKENEEARRRHSFGKWVDKQFLNDRWVLVPYLRITYPCQYLNLLIIKFNSVKHCSILSVHILWRLSCSCILVLIATCSLQYFLFATGCWILVIGYKQFILILIIFF